MFKNHKNFAKDQPIWGTEPLGFLICPGKMLFLYVPNHLYELECDSWKLFNCCWILLDGFPYLMPLRWVFKEIKPYNQGFFSLFLQGLLLNVKPEVFSALKVCSLERTDGEPCQEAYPAAADSTRSTLPCSAQSSEFSSCAASVSTEELELSMQLSRSSSEAEDSFHSTSPSPISVTQLQERPLTPPIECSDGSNEAEVVTVGKQEEAYVTMSSFYQIK